MDETELKSIIAHELDQALGVDGGKLSAERRTALEYYEGEPFGNEVDGRSQVVMRSVLEAVEWVLPALLRIFTASDKIANIEPVSEDDEQGADQATDYISHIFYRDNAGFMILHDWFKDALIQKVGWVKRWWDEQRVRETNSYTGLTEDEYAALKTPDTKVVEEKSYPAPMPGFNEDQPAPGATGMLYDCTLRVTRTQGRIRIENVPPEEILVSRRAKRGSLPFVAHRRQWTYSDLVEQGYDADALDHIPSHDAPQFNTERLARHENEDEDPGQSERNDKPMRDIWVEENYIRVDIDGDGIAELCKVVTAGSGQVILTKNGKPDIEMVDDVPLVPACPVPMPHKLVGLSLADLVQDLQLIKSTLVRQTLDNLYLTNNPRTEVADDVVNENTIDDILTSRPGGLVRTKRLGGLQQFVTPFVAEKAMGIIEYVDQTQEVRTGVSRHNQGLDPDVLNKTATGANLISQAAAQRVELIARIFAESVRELVGGILGLVKKHQQQERIIRVTGQWLHMDPRQWKNEMEVTVSVGLGTGNRDQILQHLMTILQIQQGIVVQQKGLTGPLVTGKDVFATLELLTENAGFKQSFFTDPSQPPADGAPPQQPPPDPEMMKVQAQIAADRARQEASVQADMRKEQFDMQRDQARAELERQNDERDFAFRQQVAQQDAALKRWEAEQRAALEVQQMQARIELQRAEMEHKAAQGAYAPRPAASSGAAA